MEENEVCEQTYIDDCRVRDMPYGMFGERVVWAGEATSSKPPVVIKIRPQSAADYAALLGVAVEELPVLLRYADAFRCLYNTNIAQRSKRGANCFYCYETEKPFYSFPTFGNINVCMKKTIWKKEFDKK